MSARDAEKPQEGEIKSANIEVPEVGVRGVGTPRCTSAVPEVVVGGWVVLAESLKDEFVVQQAVEGPEEEHIEGQVANLLLLKVSTQSLRLPAGPEDRKPCF